MFLFHLDSRFRGNDGGFFRGSYKPIILLYITPPDVRGSNHMCGIAGFVSLSGQAIEGLEGRLKATHALQRHRGPDGEGHWAHPRRHVGLAHQRLSIIDLSTGAQPMEGPGGLWLTFNGEIYNYIELRQELGEENFRTTSDTEVILRAYDRWGEDCVSRLRGMFAFALWDEKAQTLFCARDRFGIKPFYFARHADLWFFASECKTLMPFLPAIETDLEGLKDYLAFQLTLDGKTLFKNVRELLPGHCLTVKNGAVQERRYWEVYYHTDWHHTQLYFEEKVRELLDDSVRVHLRADVPVGAYVSGGVDSSLVASIGARYAQGAFLGFTGKFGEGDAYDESHFARAAATKSSYELLETTITHQDFASSIEKIIYHLDYPTAGPGSFPQYHVSALAAKHRKVVLGGQGGDEIFGGYARYLVAYFEQCIRAAIEGDLNKGKFVVTYESIIPNLTTLKAYKPMIKSFWAKGLFGPMDQRYFQLINRSGDLKDEVRWELLGDYQPFDTFQRIFLGNNVGKESYFDSMTHFDFKTLLPALLQVEDRMSMAHGLESRVPLLDHPLVELAATMPANVKFQDGKLKKVLREGMAHELPREILERTDKMGFPVPLTEWMQGPLKDFFMDVFTSRAAQDRPYIHNAAATRGLEGESPFGRKIWGLLSLELWHRQFHDRRADFTKLARAAGAPV